jgi:hypothetical protein
MYRSMKVVGAILLLASLALPMASCRHYEDAQGLWVDTAKGQPPPAGAREVVVYQYAWSGLKQEDPSLLPLLAFVWPPVLIGLLLRWRSGRAAVLLRVLEILLLAFSFWTVNLLATLFVDRMESGAYLAFVALGLYTLGAAWEDASAFRRWRQARQSRLALLSLKQG